MWHTDNSGFKISCISPASLATMEFADCNKPCVERTSVLPEIYGILYGDVLVSLNLGMEFPLWINCTLNIGFELSQYINCLIHEWAAANPNPSVLPSAAWIHCRRRGSEKGTTTSLCCLVFMRTHLLINLLFSSCLWIIEWCLWLKKGKGRMRFTSINHNKNNIFL